jgi:hypothetical protein
MPTLPLERWPGITVKRRDLLASFVAGTTSIPAKVMQFIPDVGHG